jgi:hypothetical protein
MNGIVISILNFISKYRIMAKIIEQKIPSIIECKNTKKVIETTNPAPSILKFSTSCAFVLFLTDIPNCFAYLALKENVKMLLGKYLKGCDAKNESI